MILILETLIETNGKADEKLFGTNSPLGAFVSNPSPCSGKAEAMGEIWVS